MFSKHQRSLRRLPTLLERCEYRPVLRTWHRSITDVRTTEDDHSRGRKGDLQTLSKPYTNLPFVKDLFLGKYDTKVLVYPEFTRTEDLHELKAKMEPIQRFMAEEVDSKAIEANGQISEDTWSRIKELGLLGQQVHPFIGGMGLDIKSYTRLNEIIGEDGSISTSVAAHHDLALQTILLYGSEEQHEKYLADIGQGKKILAYCVSEQDCGSDISSIKTQARATSDGTSFVINGTKTWVTNGDKADMFVVFAKGEIENLGAVEEHVTAFIVDRSAEGITISEPTPKLGLNGVHTCDVHFENTTIPAENLIGELGSGFQMALSVMNTSRLAEGAATTGVLKKLTEMATDHVINRKQFQKPLREFGLVQDKFARISLMTYVLESMTYLTAGVNDQYQFPDTSLESAIVKIYATEASWECLKDFVQIFGAPACLNDHPVQRYLRDAYTHSTFRGTNDMLRLYISLRGVQHAGNALVDTVRKVRNPFNNVGFNFKRGFNMLRSDPKNPKLTHKVYNHVHPTVSFAAEELEKRAHQFQDSVEFCLSAYGKELVHDQLTLKTLADIAIDLYGMTAVLARASRSKSIGLRSADHEILMAQLFAREASQRIGWRIEHIREAKYENGDEVKRRIADTMFKAKGYAVDDPLERNW